MKENTKMRHSKIFGFAFLTLAGLVLAGPVLAIDYYLVAKATDKVLPATGAADPLDLGLASVDPYGGTQDIACTVANGASVTVSPDGSTLTIVGNCWKKIDLATFFAGPYTVTADTVLEFDFKSTAEGEIHGIAFDNGPTTINEPTTIQLFGTQNYGIQAYHNYTTADGFKHYKIPVGQLYTGTFDHLAFANDHDVAMAAGEGIWRNISLYENHVAVRMWGYALDPDASPADGVGDCYASSGTGAACAAAVATVPGPWIDVPAGATALRIFLTNLLPEPTSIVIPGQEMPWSSGGSPVWTNGSTGERLDPSWRVRSFGAEADASGGQQSYVWSSFRSNEVQAGSYLYQSGTHPGLQVHMGLYGAATKTLPREVGDPPGQVAYRSAAGDATTFVDEIVLVYSEIDKALHDAAEAGDLNAAVARARTYHPNYFLINGEPFDPEDLDSQQVFGLRRNQDTLVRMLNAGLKSHVPTLRQLYMSVVAEDGKLYPHARQQYSADLPPGKTKDGIVNVATAGTYAVIDQQLALSTGSSTGGMYAFLNFITPNVIDFKQYDILSYGGSQDASSQVMIEEGGETLHIVGNGWKKIDLSPDWGAAGDLVLQFQFRSTALGEIHGIGFDDDDTIDNPIQIYQLYGTQNYGIQTYHTYVPSGWENYCIPVEADGVTGQYLTFTNDHDVTSPDGESLFRRVKLCTAGDAGCCL